MRGRSCPLRVSRGNDKGGGTRGVCGGFRLGFRLGVLWGVSLGHDGGHGDVETWVISFGRFQIKTLVLLAQGLGMILGA